MLLEKIGLISEKKPESIGWNPFWVDNYSRNSFQYDYPPFCTWRHSQIKLLLKTQDGKIINTADLPIIRRLEGEIYSKKMARCKLFKCTWENNDIPI